MADLIEEERRIILDNPLGHSLHSVREALRNAEGDTQGEAFEAERSSPSFHAASFDLFSVLFTSATLPSLNSKRKPTLTNDVARVRQCIKKSELSSQHFRRLSQLVLNQASDIDIWTAVIDMIATLNKDTPPTRAEEVWQRAKNLYSDSEKKWLHLPRQPAEDNVCSWWLGPQNDFLATEQAAYSERSRQDQDGSDSEHYGSDYEYSQELELLVKKRRTGSAVEKHNWVNWGDVLAIGRLAQSEQTEAKELLLEFGSAVREVFAQQPTRRFVHAFTMTGTTMETWVFDRSGPYSGATFNVHEESEKFVQVLCGYLMMRDEELGLDIFTKEKDGRHRYPIGEPIVSRVMTCFPAKPIGALEFDRVVKYSWIPSTWTPDADLLSKLNEHRAQGVATAKVVGCDREITRISKLRDGLTFSTQRQDQIPYDDRVLRVLTVTPLGRPLKKFESILELLECIRDAIKVHRSLYMESGILHGDISVRSIIITEPAKADGYKGMLIDLDLAHDITKGPSGTRHRTGTIEFMAIGVLLGQQHTYRHDL
ncbi:hypothetical protein E4U40_004000 [Claviceps sp. LM458 group G5]|nr:hypothetical protein E4U40_004000 [Claviceps sp. LM458 group G5]